jgi:hypothetical protein
MTVRLDNEGVIILAGECPVEDAETLLEHLQARRAGPVDWSGCTRLHTAVLQVLMAAKPKLVGECGDEFVRAWAGRRRATACPARIGRRRWIEKSES